jgi:serine/threonine-protein kinase RsbW
VTKETHLKLTLPAVPASVRRARVSVAEAAAELGASERVVDDVRLCVSEAVSNVVRHAYGTERGEVDVAVEHDDGQLAVVVHDDGPGLSGARFRGPAGGFGLTIIDKIAGRSTITSPRGAGTEVRMTFPLGSG